MLLPVTVDPAVPDIEVVNEKLVPFGPVTVCGNEGLNVYVPVPVIPLTSLAKVCVKDVPAPIIKYNVLGSLVTMLLYSVIVSVIILFAPAVVVKPAGSTFTDSSGATITFPFGDIINGANETTVINIGGTILYNAAPPVQFRKLDATAVIQAAVSGYANGTINNAVQTASGASGTYTYTVPTITANTGYVLTGGVVTLATNPVTFNSTPGQSGSGTTVGDPLIENNPTVTSGTITQISANLSQSQLAPASNISYNTSYFAQGGGSSTNVTTSGTNGSNTGALTIGNGTVNATVSKTAPTGQASGNGVITWNKNGSLQNTYTFNSGDYVYSSYTYTGVSNGDTLQTLITEN